MKASSIIAAALATLPASALILPSSNFGTARLLSKSVPRAAAPARYGQAHVSFPVHFTNHTSSPSLNSTILGANGTSGSNDKSPDGSGQAASDQGSDSVACPADPAPGDDKSHDEPTPSKPAPVHAAPSPTRHRAGPTGTGFNPGPTATGSVGAKVAAYARPKYPYVRGDQRKGNDVALRGPLPVPVRRLARP